MKWNPKGLWNKADFVKLWVGQTISNFGSGITAIALPLTAVLVLAATPAQMGILSALSGAAVLVFGLLAANLVCRLLLEKKTLVSAYLTSPSGSHLTPLRHFHLALV